MFLSIILNSFWSRWCLSCRRQGEANLSNALNVFWTAWKTYHQQVNGASTFRFSPRFPGTTSPHVLLLLLSLMSLFQGLPEGREDDRFWLCLTFWLQAMSSTGKSFGLCSFSEQLTRKPWQAFRESFKSFCANFPRPIHDLCSNHDTLQNRMAVCQNHRRVVLPSQNLVLCFLACESLG